MAAQCVCMCVCCSLVHAWYHQQQAVCCVQSAVYSRLCTVRCVAVYSLLCTWRTWRGCRWRHRTSTVQQTAALSTPSLRTNDPQTPSPPPQTHVHPSAQHTYTHPQTHIHASTNTSTATTHIHPSTNIRTPIRITQCSRCLVLSFTDFYQYASTHIVQVATLAQVAKYFYCLSFILY